MISCTKCGSTELLVMRTRINAEFVRRWFGLFGKKVPRMTISTLDVACSECLCAMSANAKRVVEAPIQTAHEQLLAAQSQKNGPPPENKDAPEPTPRSLPARPAGDPRVRQRR